MRVRGRILGNGSSSTPSCGTSEHDRDHKVAITEHGKLYFCPVVILSTAVFVLREGNLREVGTLQGCLPSCGSFEHDADNEKAITPPWNAAPSLHRC